ncbi:hypothetical protein T484DRAFT_1771311 [Baffinella frigidus]|nr:hypothetical protein T484DRAFT_1771311 [Cryptophyta sp. CCMP2293]
MGHVLDQVEHGGAGELVIAVVMIIVALSSRAHKIIIGFCVGSLVMRARNRTPSFNEKPSAYMTRMENEAEEGYEMDGLGDVDPEAEEGYEMDGLGDVDPQNETSPSLRR